eukprot:42356_1
MSVSPTIKIKDSMAAFMSYIFGINAAIKQFIKPEPVICPFIVNLWIIPNRTVQIRHNNEQRYIDNDIGDIKERLKQNKVTYIVKKCNPNNIDKFSNQITKCLSNRRITEVMESQKLQRIIFIVDRRFKSKDSLYCILPPPEYGQIITSSHDTIDLSHLYCNANYLLPHLPTYDKNIRNNHIGSNTNLNGYMFNLSFLIYQFQEEAEEDDNHEEKKKEKKKKKKENVFQSKTKKYWKQCQWCLHSCKMQKVMLLIAFLKINIPQQISSPLS